MSIPFELDRQEHTLFFFVGLRPISEVFQTFSRSMCMSTATGCLFFVERFSSLHLGVGRQALHPTCPAASSAIVASTSEGEGLHADPLPHSLCEYIFDVSVFFGGRGTALNPSSSHCRWVLRRRRDRSFSSQHQYVLCLPGFRR